MWIKTQNKKIIVNSDNVTHIDIDRSIRDKKVDITAWHGSAGQYTILGSYKVGDVEGVFEWLSSQIINGNHCCMPENTVEESKDILEGHLNAERSD